MTEKNKSLQNIEAVTLVFRIRQTWVPIPTLQSAKPWPWAISLASLCLCFLTSELRPATLPSSQGC